MVFLAKVRHGIIFMASGSQGVIYEGKDVDVNFMTGVRGMTGF
jgi:hypothetical protein